MSYTSKAERDRWKQRVKREAFYTPLPRLIAHLEAALALVRLADTMVAASTPGSAWLEWSRAAVPVLGEPDD